MGEILLLLVFPIILAIAASYAPFVILVAFLARGSNQTLIVRAKKAWVVCIVALSIIGYAIGIAWLHDPDLLPGLKWWIDRGGLALLVPVLILDAVLGSIFYKAVHGIRSSSTPQVDRSGWLVVSDPPTSPPQEPNRTAGPPGPCDGSGNSP